MAPCRLQDSPSLTRLRITFEYWSPEFATLIHSELRLLCTNEMLETTGTGEDISDDLIGLILTMLETRCD